MRTYSYQSCSTTVMYENMGKVVAKGVIADLPGCSQVAIFHSAFVLDDERNRGFGAKAHDNRLLIAESLLYDYALCTVDMDNAAQQKILLSRGWQLIGNFTSSKTKHGVGIFGREIKCGT